jgi:hypothetical protein
MAIARRKDVKNSRAATAHYNCRRGRKHAGAFVELPAAVGYIGFNPGRPTSDRKTRPLTSNRAMQFIEMTGKTLLEMDHVDALQPEELRKTGVVESSVVRINRQGDIELRRRDRWDVIGGLIGDFEHRVQKATGLDWA